MSVGQAAAGFLVETSAFVASSVALQGVVFALVALVPMPMMFRRGAVSYVTVLTSFAVFNLSLIFGGIWASCYWVVTTVGSMYVSVDPIVHWTPYWPFSDVGSEQWGEVRSGLRNGATVAELKALWWALAWPVWLLALATWILCRRRAVAGVPTFVSWLGRPTVDSR